MPICLFSQESCGIMLPVTYAHAQVQSTETAGTHVYVTNFYLGLCAPLIASSHQVVRRHTLLTAQFWAGSLPSNQAATVSCPETQQQWRDSIWAATSRSSDAAQEASASSSRMLQASCIACLPWHSPVVVCISLEDGESLLTRACAASPNN